MTPAQVFLASAHRELLAATSWLYTVVFAGRYFFLDLWSVVHAGCGAVLFALLRRRRVPAAGLWLMTILLAYEVLEMGFLAFGVGLFRPEILPDQLTDLAVGALGALGASWHLRRGAATGRGPAPAASLSAAASIAFLWVGFYGYRYNRPSLNSDGLNWWAATLWTGGLLASLRVRRALARRTGPRRAFAGGWLVYGTGLVALECVGYHLLGIREARSAVSPPLVLGVIHGSTAMKSFYALGFPIAIVVERLAARLFRPLASTAGSPTAAAPVLLEIAGLDAAAGRRD